MRRAILCLALAAGLAARQARAATPFLEPVVTGANNPMYVVDPGRNDGALFVVERAGLIRVASGGTLQASNEAFLDVTSLVNDEGEGGLLSMALDPNFAANRRFFVAYTRTGSGGSPLETVIASYQAKADDPNHADPTTAKELLTQLSPVGPDFTNHKGGTLLFSPVDHLLYYGFGDGGSGGDPHCNAQQGTTLLGKMIRIDPNGSDPNHPNYGIPADNPFASATDGTRPEIWAFGVRNPFRFSFDQTGDLWIGDVGQDTREEVDRQLSSSHGGENYGWKIWEGFHCFAHDLASNGTPLACPASVATCANDSSPHDGYVFPVVNYPHSFGNVVIGGYVYRGSNAVWRGRYVFADWGTSKILALLEPNAPPDPRALPLVLSHGDVSGPVAFAEDQTGELLVVGLFDGNVYRMHFDALGLPRTQARCVVKLNQDFAGLADFESGKIRSCIDQGARGRALVGTCIDADPKSALAKRRARIAADDAKLCFAAPPDFGYAGAGPGSAAAVSSEQDLFGAVFGDPNAAIPSKRSARNTVLCQESVAKALTSCQHVRRAEFLRCKARGIADRSITSSASLALCLSSDPKGAIARACDGKAGAIATRVIPRACTKLGVDLKLAFPGCNPADPGALAQCLDNASQSQTCNLFNDADALGTTCP